MRGVPSCSTPLSLCCGSAAPAPFLYCLILPEAHRINPPALSGPDSSRMAGGLSPVSSEPGRADGQLHGARRDATTLGAEHAHPDRHAPHSRAMSFQSRLVTIGVGVSRTSAARRCSVVIRSAVAGWEAK